jgi:hypothetical protein
MLALMQSHPYPGRAGLSCHTGELRIDGHTFISRCFVNIISGFNGFFPGKVNRMKEKFIFR